MQVGPRLDLQALARRGEAEQHRRGLAAARGAHEQPVLASNGDPLHLSFGDVVVARQEAGPRVTD